MEKVDSFLEKNPTHATDHHLQSYNHFCASIPKLIQAKNPLVFTGDDDADHHVLNLYFGGKDGKGVRLVRPTLYPNEARLHHQSYEFALVVDLEAEYVVWKERPVTVVFPDVVLAHLPVMLQSDLCPLARMPPDVLHAMGECRNDPGGYFVMDGQEKTAFCQEQMANVVNVQVARGQYTHTADVSGCKVGLVRDTPSAQCGQIWVEMPNVQPIPLFIVMRALGIETDKEIVEFCLLDSESALVDALTPSVHDAGKVFAQVTALDYLKLFVKDSVLSHLNQFMPHMGVGRFVEKAYFLGFMVRKLLRVAHALDAPTDLHSLAVKRVVPSGTLLANLFAEHYDRQLQEVAEALARDFRSKCGEGNATEVFRNLISSENYFSFFRKLPLQEGIREAFRNPPFQTLNRASFFSALSDLRACAAARIHPSQFGFLDPVDSGSLALLARVTLETPEIDGLDEVVTPLGESTPAELLRAVRVMVNGAWFGSTVKPATLMNFLRRQRRTGEISPHVNFGWNVGEKAIHIHTDAGRLQRPLFYVEDGKMSDSFEYLDAAESESAFIAVDKVTTHTHVEVHGSLLLGSIGNALCFPEHTPAVQSASACGHVKKAAAYANCSNRMDNVTVLQSGQTPAVKSAYLGQHAFGANTLVAVMAYNGYNADSAILLNKASVDRGLLAVTRFNTYAVAETADKHVTSAVRFKAGMDYASLGPLGVVEEGKRVDENTVLIGAVSGREDASVAARRPGVVDKVYVTAGHLGSRLAKVRVADSRKMDEGDLFATRTGLNGVCGQVVPEQDMPFTADGVRPDVIVNPHAILDRMAVGHMLESLVGKVHLFHGTFGDCTAFESSTDMYADMLPKCGFHKSGCELLYNGLTGEQVEAAIFVGPAYLMRLDKQVKPRKGVDALTRQPVGQQMGEMDCASVLGHGMAACVKDAFMARSDAYRILVDNASGMPAIHNELLGVTLAPVIDGPIQFNSANELTTNPKHNLTFTTVNVPYSFKLLMQELTTMNVQMRLLTAEHIDQLRWKEVHKQFLRPSKFGNLSLLCTKRLNELYVSPTATTAKFNVYHYKTINPNIFPFVTDAFLPTSVRLTPRRSWAPVYNKAKYKMKPYQELKDVEPSMTYFYEKMKTGIFVRIKNNGVVNFNPFYNPHFENDYSLHFPEGEAAFLERLKRETKRKHADVKKWQAANCLLRTELEDRDPPTTYLAEIYDMLVNTCFHRKVADCVFFLNRKDFPHLHGEWKEAFGDLYGDAELPAKYHKPFVPVLSQCTTDKHADIAIPTADDWASITQQYFGNYDRREMVFSNRFLTPHMVPWEERGDKFGFRGQATGCSGAAPENVRLHLATLAAAELDVEVRPTNQVRVTQGKKGAEVEFTLAPVKKVEPMSMAAQMKNFKFIFNVEGNSAAYRFGSLFQCGFCILNVETKYKLWFEPFLTTGPVGDTIDASKYHCITVDRKLATLPATVRWCVNNMDACRQIAENGRQFYEKYFTREFVYDYVSDTLNAISRLEAHVKPMSVRGAAPPNMAVKKFNAGDSDLSKVLLVVPFRDRKDHLEEFLKHYSTLNILVVEQEADHRDFNRGALLNAGFHFAAKHVPEIEAFVFHDADVIVPMELVQKYYGEDGREVVHLGLLADTEVALSAAVEKRFLGRALRVQKNTFKEINGFPNYFSGGEDDALLHRMDGMTVFRPDEEALGHVLPSKNKETVDVAENLALDKLIWRTNGVNSIVYEVTNHVLMEVANIHKITIKLAPARDIEEEEKEEKDEDDDEDEDKDKDEDKDEDKDKDEDEDKEKEKDQDKDQDKEDKEKEDKDKEDDLQEIDLNDIKPKETIVIHGEKPANLGDLEIIYDTDTKKDKFEELENTDSLEKEGAQIKVVKLAE